MSSMTDEGLRATEGTHRRTRRPSPPPPVAAAHRRRCARWTIQSQSAHIASVHATVGVPAPLIYTLAGVHGHQACVQRPAVDARFGPRTGTRRPLGHRRRFSCQTAWTRHGTSRAHGPAPLYRSGPRRLAPTSQEAPSAHRAGPVRKATPQTRCTGRPRQTGAPTGHAKACAQTRRT